MEKKTNVITLPILKNVEIDYYNLNRGTETPDYEYMTNLECFQMISKNPLLILKSVVNAFKINNIRNIILIYDINKYDITYKDFFEIMKLCIDKNNNIEQKQTILNKGPHMISMYIDDIKKYYDVNKIDFLCYLIEYFKFDFQDLNICKKMFLLLSSDKVYRDILNHLNIINFDTIGIFKYFKIILQNLYASLDDNSNQINENISVRDIVLEILESINSFKNNYKLNETSIIHKLIRLKDINLFKLLLSIGYANTNISKWHKFFISFYDTEFFKLYYEFNQIKIISFDFFWDSINENINYLDSLKKIDYIFYFYENFEFKINTTKILYLLKSKKEFQKLINLIPYLNNNEFYYKYLNLLFNKDEIITLINEYPNMLDNYYMDYILNIALNFILVEHMNKSYDATVDIINYIINKYPNPTTLENLHQIFIDIIKKCPGDIIELIFEFISPIFNIKSHDNLVFKSIYEIGKEIDDLEWNECLFNWFCSKVEHEYYEIYLNSNIIIGYRCGNDIYGHDTINKIDKIIYLEHMQFYNDIKNIQLIDSCPICYDKQPNIITKCNHQFCSDCIDKILCRYMANTNINSNTNPDTQLYIHGILSVYDEYINEIPCPYCRQLIYPLERLK